MIVVNDLVGVAWDAIARNRLRAALTALAITIGIATITATSSCITGVDERTKAWADSFGTNVLWCFPWNAIRMNPTAEMLGRKQLTIEDAQAIVDLPHVVSVNAARQYANFNLHSGVVDVKYKGRKMQQTILEGDLPAVSVTNNATVTSGRMFNDDDDLRRANVGLLGHDVAARLFEDEDPIGAEVEIAGELFTVIGVMQKLPHAFGTGRNPQDNKVILPLSTFHKIHPEVRDTWISVKYDQAENRSLVQEEIRDLLRIRRRVRVERDDDFEIFSPDSLLRLWSNIRDAVILLMLTTSSIGLLVGGVGIMNVMLVCVTERTREIGVRRAVGATQRDILMQFLVEAITLCAVGGAIGVALGIFSAFLIPRLFPVPCELSSFWLIFSFLLSCIVGLIFGTYPAWKAAHLDPQEALRYE